MYTTNTLIELVVAKYTENVGWIDNIKSDVKVTIYDKSTNPIQGSIPLPNVGRETHTYFTHITNNYDTLYDWVIFCQGDPLFHISYFIDLVNNFPNINYESTLKVNECYFYNTCFGNKLVVSDNFGKPHDFRGINVSNTWGRLFKSPQPETLYFSPGCQFIVSKNQLHKRGKDFFNKCLDITLDNKYSPWEFERIMHNVMNPNFN